MRRDARRLRDLLEVAAAIEQHTTGGRPAFDADALVRVWCLKHIGLIGEALSRLSGEFETSRLSLHGGS